jgi:hypothetical protein
MGLGLGFVYLWMIDGSKSIRKLGHVNHDSARMIWRAPGIRSVHISVVQMKMHVGRSAFTGGYEGGPEAGLAGFEGSGQKDVGTVKRLDSFSFDPFFHPTTARIDQDGV